MADSSVKTGKVKAGNDVYTALLALASLALAGTIGYVCWRSIQLYGSIGLF